MSRGAESQPNPEKKGGGFLNAWKKFNKVTGFIWLALGVATEQAGFFIAAGIDFAQNELIKRWQERRKTKKAAKNLGGKALRGVLQPA